ncbi:MAG: tRNA 2-selenouridine(34) synthase MnmH [Deferribacterales bacterium]
MQEELTLSFILEKGLDTVNLIDVRSPSEFIHDNIPMSVNIPLLDDAERALVGTCYVQKGPKDARMLGVDIISPKLPQFVRQIMEASKDHRMTIAYCWRGGLRSGSTVGLMTLTGVNIYRLQGGYKVFRNHVNDFFSGFSDDYSFINLHGPTGSAKTHVLRSLEAEGLRVLDLEKAASHKGSNFGDVDEPGYDTVNQKNFETKLWHTFYNKGAGVYLVEGESMKIGRVSIPQKLFRRMNTCINVVADVPLDARIRFTVDNYKPNLYIDDIRRSLDRLKKFIGKSGVDELSKLLDVKDYETFTKILLESYYDPLYRRSIPENPDYMIRYENIEEGKKQLEQIYMENQTS